MKKSNSFIATIILGISLVSCASTKSIPEKKVKLDFEAPIRASFSVIDLDEDLAAVKYLVTTSYAGYPQALEKGFDVDASINEIKEATLNNLTSLGMVDSKYYQNKIFEVLSRDMKVNDMHFSVSGFGVSTRPVAKYLRFTDLYFERNGEEYFLYKTEDDRIPVGAKFTGPERNLYEYFFEDRVIYRYAVYATPGTNRLTVSLNGEQYPVSVIKNEELKSKSKLTNVIETDDCVYVSLNTFSISSTGNDYFLFFETCKKLATENPNKTVILDLRQNGGGIVYFASQLIASIYFPYDTEEHMDFYNFLLKESYKHQLEQKSEADREKREFYKKQLDAQNKNELESGYVRDQEIVLENNDVLETYDKDSLMKRRVIILMDGGSASSSEYTIGLSYLSKDADVTLVGNRTVGAVDYVSNWDYVLPKSGLRMFYGKYFGASPCITQNENFHGEGEGFWPDWWTTNENILNTLVQLTGDESLSEKLPELGKYKY
ncbi:MAG: S41 family peptidase [Treponema sp.]|nr:S41 family peptidase [Treponema sp.]